MFWVIVTLLNQVGVWAPRTSKMIPPEAHYISLWSHRILILWGSMLAVCLARHRYTVVDIHLADSNADSSIGELSRITALLPDSATRIAMVSGPAQIKRVDVEMCAVFDPDRCEGSYA